jgi:hypothetical protein
VNNEILRSILTFNGAGKVSKELSWFYKALYRWVFPFLIVETKQDIRYQLSSQILRVLHKHLNYG